ncbi:MAG: hypothetical protein M1814_003165 [Vezdaea aestivalis]|nr:MAG: hypothetical protein M1814_003165 [Vezdaea aestivalis]
MPLGMNNPLPSSLRSECKKCGKILASFVDPRQAFAPDKVIPPSILENAKGLAIFTVLKFGFLGSVRGGSGLVIARLGDGTWSAPSAIGTVGGGFGGQIGFELTDFVFILNDAAAVRTFAQAGSVTLGGNVSIAAGPVGRNAEAAGAASLKGVSGVFAYSKTKGLFAGVSLEGSGLIERKDANEKLYGRRVTARELLGGNMPPPPAADMLLRVLNSRAFKGVPNSSTTEDMYNDIPRYEDEHDDVVWEGRRGEAEGEGVRRDRTGSLSGPQRATTWNDDIYDRPRNTGINRSFTTKTTLGDASPRIRSGEGFGKPTRPTAPKPKFAPKKQLEADQAVALFSFDADQDGDLGFKKGDIITILKRTEKKEDWWTGRIGNKEGIFPRRTRRSANVITCTIVSFGGCTHFQYLLKETILKDLKRSDRQTIIKHLPDVPCARCAYDQVRPEAEGDYEKYDKAAFAEMEKSASEKALPLPDEAAAQSYMSPDQWLFMQCLAMGRIIQIRDNFVTIEAVQQAYAKECETNAELLRHKIRGLNTRRRKGMAVSDGHLAEVRARWGHVRASQGISQGRILQGYARWRAKRIGMYVYGLKEMNGTVCGGPGGGEGQRDPWYKPEYSELGDPAEEWEKMPDNEPVALKAKRLELALKRMKSGDAWSDYPVRLD